MRDYIGPYRECGEGWFDLIDEFLSSLTPEQIQHDVNQIKEKFGALNIYCNQFGLNTLARDFEKRSASICEMTGEPGSLHQKGHWLKTLSPVKALELGFTPTKLHATELTKEQV
jgi:hypothetical protein